MHIQSQSFQSLAGHEISSHSFIYQIFFEHQLCARQCSQCFRLTFCCSWEINSFFCDIPPLLAISCSDTSLNELLLFAICGFIQTATVLAITVSYGFIAGAVIRMRSVEGRRRAASTCCSHLTAVAMMYGTLIFMYLRPSSSYALDTDKMASVFYTLVIPALNPLIYSLRNKEVKEALRRTWSRFRRPGQGPQ